ncbi:MAG TPA: N-acetylmuramoyl-L-alanine amidase [bacterium]|nr:N-acetylmuramoyl-L-alanine amidase [bacterium]
MHTVCLIIGHSSSAGGAYNPDSGLTEWQFNYNLAHRVMGYFTHELDKVDLRLVHRGTEQGNSYELMETVDVVNQHDPVLAVSLHANAYNRERGGHCVLHAQYSKRGNNAAKIFMQCLARALGNPDRGIRERDNLAILTKTRAPTVVLEPFFIDNSEDCLNAQQRIYKLGYWIHEGIMQYLTEYGG